MELTHRYYILKKHFRTPEYCLFQKIVRNHLILNQNNYLTKFYSGCFMMVHRVVIINILMRFKYMVPNKSKNEFILQMNVYSWDCLW